MDEIAPAVYRLGSEWVNFYLIDDGGSLTIVDTGLPGYVPVALSALDRLDREQRDVRAIVLTHTHIDHIGGAAALAEKTGAPVFVPQEELGLATGDAQPAPPKAFLMNLWRPHQMSFLVHAVQNGGAKRVKVVAPVGYENDDVLDVPGKPRAVSCPGHSRGHSALLLEDRKVLFSGDALSTLATHTGARGPMLHPFNEDPDRAVESLGALENVDAEIVAPGHGEPWRSAPSEAVRIAKERL